MSYDAIGRACVICKKKNCAVPGNRTQHLQLTNKLPYHQSSRLDGTRMGTLFPFSCLLSIMLSNRADPRSNRATSVSPVYPAADPLRRTLPVVHLRRQLAVDRSGGQLRRQLRLDAVAGSLARDAGSGGPLRRAAPAGCGSGQPSGPAPAVALSAPTPAPTACGPKSATYCMPAVA